jgi:formamidopyrimidine-DNA glycosylase
MPELPEVETIRRQLAKVLPGQRIIDWSLDTPKMLRSAHGGVEQHLLRQRVIRVGRRAKLLILSFASGQSLLIHLKMTGQVIFQPVRGALKIGGHPIAHGDEGLPNKFTRAIFRFQSGAVMYFNDVRKFGYLRVVPTAELKDHFDDLHLGVEPLTTAFTLARFEEFFRRYPNRLVYQLLMDQSLIAGLGNIYVNEACFRARVRPILRAGKLTSKERRAMFKAIRTILPFAIRHKGTSLSDYRDAHGRRGGMEAHLQVYGRSGLPCVRRDGGLLQRVAIGGRSAVFCPVCQR